MGNIAADLPKTGLPALRLRSTGDDRLARLVAAGDRRAFAVVYERHHQAVYRYCRSILGDPDDAADALQSTMAAALRGLTGETRQIRLKPWLFRIAHNESMSLLRSRRPGVAMDESLELVAPEGADLATRERLRELVADLKQLPDAQRSALVLRELSGLGYDEIATVLGCTLAGARQTVFEARSSLHELAEGRAMDCESVRRTLSDNDGRALRGRKLRAHLRACGSCRDFQELIGVRRRDLAAIAPALPAVAAAGVLHQLLGGAAASAGSGGAGAGLGSLAAGKALAASGILKATAAVVVTAAVGVGAVETVQQAERPHHTSATPAAVNSARAGHARALGAEGTLPASSGATPAAAGASGAGATHRSASSIHATPVRRHGVGHRRAATLPGTRSHGVAAPVKAGHSHAKTGKRSHHQKATRVHPTGPGPQHGPKTNAKQPAPTAISPQLPVPTQSAPGPSDLPRTSGQTRGRSLALGQP